MPTERSRKPRKATKPHKIPSGDVSGISTRADSRRGGGGGGGRSKGSRGRMGGSGTQKSSRA